MFIVSSMLFRFGGGTAEEGEWPCGCWCSQEKFAKYVPLQCFSLHSVTSFTLHSNSLRTGRRSRWAAERDWAQQRSGQYSWKTCWLWGLAPGRLWPCWDCRAWEQTPAPREQEAFMLDCLLWGHTTWPLRHVFHGGSSQNIAQRVQISPSCISAPLMPSVRKEVVKLGLGKTEGWGKGLFRILLFSFCPGLI